MVFKNSYNVLVTINNKKRQGAFIMSIFGKLFGDIFDFNADGQTDESEQRLGYKIYKDVTAENNSEDSNVDIISNGFIFSNTEEF
jgi:hypothetical protein